ncbi:hypothetical protein ABER96_03285 [Bacillus subtilis]
MESFSIWSLNKQIKFEDVINNYKNYKEWRKTEKDPYSGVDLAFEIEVDSNDDYIYKMEDDDKTSVKYAYIFYRREKVYSKERNNPNKDKRINLFELYFYVFEYLGNIKFIALRGTGPNTLTMLRAANNCKANNEIVSDDLDITEDFFYWVFQRHMNFPEKELYPKSESYVDALTGYSGNTRDQVNNMWGKGNRISRILVTLAFLFNNENLRSLTPDLKYKDQNLEVELTLSGTYKFNEESHLGRYIFLADAVKKKACLLLLFVLEIFPNVKKAYNSHCKEGTWGPDHQLNFIAGIGAEIQDRVEEKLQDINKKLKEKEETEVEDGVL